MKSYYFMCQRIRHKYQKHKNAAIDEENSPEKLSQSSSQQLPTKQISAFTSLIS